MRHKLPTSLVAFGLVVALLVSAASASPDGESRRGGTLRLLWGAPPDSLDPALARGDVGSWLLLSLTCAKLFTTLQDPDTSEPSVVSEVVRTWRRSNGGRTYTFELKRTFRFHTGERVTAQSFVAAFNRNADPRMDSPVASRGFLQDIVGADAVVQGDAKGIAGVRALGPYRLRIRLKRPAADFVARLTMPYFCPIVPGTPIAPIDRPPGSGRYYIADLVTNRRIVIERNPYYGGGRTANPDHIVWTIEPDRRGRLEAIEHGEHDFVLVFDQPNAVMRDLVAEYGLNRPGGQLFRMPSGFFNNKLSFTFNQERSAFEGAGQAPLRKAINYVIDRPELARAWGYLAYRRSDRLLPEALSKSRRLYPLRGTAPVAALRWLARAGRRPPTLNLYTSTFGFDVKSAEVFIFNLRQLGIEVEPHYFAFLTLQEKLRTQGEPWDIAPRGVTPAYPDPAAAFIPLLRGTRYETRGHAINRLANDTARTKAWADLEADLMSDDPPLAAYADWKPLFFVSRNFGCWGPGRWLDFAAVCKK